MLKSSSKNFLKINKQVRKTSKSSSIDPDKQNIPIVKKVNYQTKPNSIRENSKSNKNMQKSTLSQRSNRSTTKSTNKSQIKVSKPTTISQIKKNIKTANRDSSLSRARIVQTPQVNKQGKLKANGAFKNLRSKIKRQEENHQIKPLKKQISIHDFLIMEQIEKNSISYTFKAYNKDTGLLISLTIINKAQVKNDNSQQRIIESLKVRFFLSSNSKIHNIKKLYGMFADEQSIYLIEEYLPKNSKSSLEEVIKKGKMTSNEVRMIISPIIKTIRYAHQHRCIFRNLFSNNLMNCFGVWKIANLEYSTHLIKQKMRMSFYGTIENIPPELFLGQCYDESIDSWNIGKIIYQMSTGLKLVNSKEDINILRNLNNIGFPLSMDDDLVDLLTNVLTLKQQRITMKMIQDHSFFSRRDSLDDEIILRDICSFWMKK